MHCTSTYPCEPEELNLKMVETLRSEFPNIPIGYSGHEVGLGPFGGCGGLGCLHGGASSDPRPRHVGQ